MTPATTGPQQISNSPRYLRQSPVCTYKSLRDQQTISLSALSFSGRQIHQKTKYAPWIKKSKCASRCVDLKRRNGEETNRLARIKNAHELGLISQNIKLALFFLSGTDVYSTVIGHEMWSTLKIIVCLFFKLWTLPIILNFSISMTSCEDVTNRITKYLG